MKKIIIALSLCLITASAVDVRAQGFLKGLKEKAEKTVKDAGKNLGGKKSKVNDNRAESTSASGSASASEAAAQSVTTDNDGSPVPPALAGIHHGTIDSPLEFKTPAVTSSTAHVTVENNTHDISEFFDGVAYVYSEPSDKAFYIDKRGNKLFETDPLCLHPRFSDGVVMETVPVKVDKYVRIRDKRGNIIKEFPSAIAASHFVNGVAVIADKPAPLKPVQLRYVDRNGNFIFPDLPSSTTQNSISLQKCVELMRPLSDGLAAFFAEIDGEDLWGFRDANGKIVVKPVFDEVGDFSEGLAAVKSKVDNVEKWGFIDRSGRMVIPQKFTHRPSDFNSGLSMVSDKNGYNYYMDKSGNFTLGPIKGFGDDPKEGDIFFISPFQGGYAIIGFFTLHPEIENYFIPVYAVIDPSMRKLGWAQLGSHLTMASHPYIYYDGKYYVYQNLGGAVNLIRFNPRNFDRIGQPENELYQEDLMILINRYGGKNGFINTDGNYEILIEESPF